MKLSSIFFLFLSAHCVILYAQCPISGTDVPPFVCTEQKFEISRPVSDVNDIVTWDLCAGDLIASSSAQEIVTLTNISAPRGIATVQSGEDFFSFIIGENNRFIRMHYPSGIESLPEITNYQNVGNLLATPRGITHVFENGNHYFIVANQSGSLILVNFGDDLLSTPSVSTMSGLPALGGVTNLKILNYNDHKLLYVIGVGTGSRQIVLLDFGTSIFNTPTSSTLNFPTASGLSAISFIQECNEWYGLLTSNFNSRYFKLHLGSDPRTIEAQEEFTDIVSPLGVELRWESGNYYGFISTNTGNVIRVDFGSDYSLTGKNGLVDLGNYSLLSQTRAFEMISDGTLQYALGVGYSDKKVSLIKFANTCSTSSPIVEGGNELFTEFLSSGSFTISTTVINGSYINRSSEDLIVQPLLSPDITFSSQNLCAQHDINFSSANQSGDITNYQWDFDDGITLSQSDATNPTHIYTTASTYYPSLTVTASNGCQNFVRDTLKIYDPPSAGFTLPSGLLCTNNNFMFINTTTDVYDSNLTYQWFVDDTEASADRDLLYAFNSTGIKNIKLITSIPGCSNEIIQSTSEVKAGPVVDFSFSGHCEDQQVTFTNSISDDVDDYLWNFGDGNISGSPNPENVFTSAGDYSVSLTATSPNGCNNSHVKEVTIYNNPSVDFATNPPPHSCSGSSTAFTNLTADPFDGTVASWLWNFGDAGNEENESTLQDPSHVFANAGTFNVSLTATTDQGCSGTLQKPIEISSSPLVSIEHSSACSEVSTNFTAIGNDILYYYWIIGTAYYEEKDAIHTFNAPGDYEVKLIVQGNNNCETTVTQNISVPAPLVPDFSVTKNCAGYEAVFTDITSGVDPVISQQWEFAAIGNGSGSPATFTFTDTGNKSVTLKVTAQSGCSYITTKTVNIIQAPVAGFTVFPEEGGAPLEVQFTNTSTGATQYAWAFGDVSTSTEVSPLFIFQDAGDFTTVLTASNNAGCESTFAKSINVLTPLPDVDVRNINVLENPDGTMNVIVTLQNKGNTFLKGLPLDVDLSGKVKLREVIEESIAPSSLYNVVLDYAITDPDAIGFLCVQTFLEGDLAPDGNRVCIELNEEAHWFMPYPNPVSDLLVLEWISPEEQPVKFELVDAFGKISLRAQVASHAGLNRTVYDVSNLRSGVYMLVFSSGSTSSTRRILITGQN